MKRKALGPPEWLEPVAKQEWARLVASGAVVVEPGNKTVVEAYCQNYARWLAAEQLLTQEGTEVVIRDDKGGVKLAAPSPQVGIANKYHDRMLKAAFHLGLGLSNAGPARSTKGARAVETTGTSFFGSVPALN